MILINTVALVWCIWITGRLAHRLIDWHRDRSIRKLMGKPLLTHDEVDKIVRDARK